MKNQITTNKKPLQGQKAPKNLKNTKQHIRTQWKAYIFLFYVRFCKMMRFWKNYVRKNSMKFKLLTWIRQKSINYHFWTHNKRIVWLWDSIFTTWSKAIQFHTQRNWQDISFLKKKREFCKKCNKNVSNKLNCLNFSRNKSISCLSSNHKKKLFSRNSWSSTQTKRSSKSLTKESRKKLKWNDVSIIFLILSLIYIRKKVFILVFVQKISIFCQSKWIASWFSKKLQEIQQENK